MQATTALIGEYQQASRAYARRYGVVRRPAALRQRLLKRLRRRARNGDAEAAVFLKRARLWRRVASFWNRRAA